MLWISSFSTLTEKRSKSKYQVFLSTVFFGKGPKFCPIRSQKTLFSNSRFLLDETLFINEFQLLLVGSASVMTTNVFTMVLRILSTVFRYCTSLTTEFIKQGNNTSFLVQYFIPVLKLSL